MAQFCPGCFSLDKKLSALEENNKYKCPKCMEEFPLNATMVSEDSVRTYIMGYPKGRGHLLYQLNKLINPRREE